MKSVSANIARSFALAAPTTIKAGFSINRQRKDNTSVLKTWTFAPPASVSRLAKDYDLTNDMLSQQSFFSDTLKLKWISPTKYYDLFKAHPDWFTISDAATHQSGVTQLQVFRGDDFGRVCPHRRKIFQQPSFGWWVACASKRPTTMVPAL